MMTPQIAVSGTAIKTPMKPKSAPKMKRPKMIQTGCNPIFDPINFGVRKFDSMSCPKIKISETCAMWLTSNPHWNKATTIAEVTPQIIPTNGMKENNPVKNPIKNPKLIGYSNPNVSNMIEF